jgi:transposase-like protein
MVAKRGGGQAVAADQDDRFRGRHFMSEVILCALHWDLAFPISYRDLVLMLSDRGEQDQRVVKQLVKPGLGFGSLRTAERTSAGYEAVAMIRKRQIQNIGGHNMQAWTAFVARLFTVAA